MRAYGTKKIRGQSNEFFLPLGRELEVVLLQVARRGGLPKANYGRAPRISIGSENSKCSYIERTFTSYCNRNLLITQLVLRDVFLREI